MRRPARSLSRAFGAYQGGAAPVLNGTPVWNSPAAGFLGTFPSATAYSQPLDVTCPLGGSATFSIVSGALPGGLSLSGSSITGAPSNPASDTTYNFTVRATSSTADYADRAFSMTVQHSDKLDQWSDYVYGLWHFDGDYTDASAYARTLATASTSANAGVVTTLSKFGTGSLYFNGANVGNVDIRIPANAALNVTGDFCLEFWARPGTPQQYTSWMQTAGGAVGYVGTTAPTNSIQIAASTNNVFPTDGPIKVYLPSSLSITGTTNPNDNVWRHFAVARSGSTVTLYVNGTSEGSVTYSGPVDFGQQYGFLIGRWINKATNNAYIGYFDDLRLTIGVPRYTANFTVPSAAFGYP